MEAGATLEVILELHKLGISVEFIVSDNDNTLDTIQIVNFLWMYLNRHSYTIPYTA